MNKLIILLAIVVGHNFYAVDKEIYNLETLGKATLTCKSIRKKSELKQENLSDGLRLVSGGEYIQSTYLLTDDNNSVIWEKVHSSRFCEHHRAAGTMPNFKIYLIQEFNKQIYIVYNVNNRLLIEIIKTSNNSWQSCRILDLSEHLDFFIRHCKSKLGNEKTSFYLLGIEKQKETSAIVDITKNGSVTLTTNLYPINNSIKKSLPKSPTTNKVLEQGNRGEAKQLKLLWLACIVLTVSLIIQLRKGASCQTDFSLRRT